MVIDIFNTDKRYDLILADPAWKQSKGGKKKVRKKSSGLPLDYKTCSLDEIKEHLRAATELTSDNAILFLWTIEKYLFEAEHIAQDLGWKLHCRMVWNKVTGIPAAFSIRFGHEYLLYMYKGKFEKPCKQMQGKYHSVFTEKVVKHSKKPCISYKMIEYLYPLHRKIELYARQERNNWDCWGNEV